jgi:hypothetical protein
VRWAAKSPAVVLLPLAVAAAAILGGLDWVELITLCAALLAWIRSGICFPSAGPPRFVLEILLAGGGAVTAGLLAPDGGLGLGFGIWVFFLVQSAFFLLVPTARTAKGVRDRFAETLRDLEKIIENV